MRSVFLVASVSWFYWSLLVILVPNGEFGPLEIESYVINLLFIVLK